MVHFNKKEYECKCGCGADHLDSRLLDKLEAVRLMYGKPMYINSGVRCEEHNRNVGGSPTSSHMLGLATDIRVSNSAERYKLVDLFIKAGIRRIGVYNTFIHVDVDDNKPQDVIWYG